MWGRYDSRVIINVSHFYLRPLRNKRILGILVCHKHKVFIFVIDLILYLDNDVLFD